MISRNWAFSLKRIFWLAVTWRLPRYWRRMSPVLIENFSIRPANNTPFLYAFLSSSAATAMAGEERRVAIGMAGLQYRVAD
jgi:hypothetical protein